MRAKWAESSSRTIRIPSVQTILLTILLVGAMTAIVWVSIVVQNETPRPPAPEGATEGPAAWLSAWSTFWGAVAGGLAAIGTAGALLLGARTYSRQVRDQHRAQAAAVTLVLSVTQGWGNLSGLVRNDSHLPIFNVALVGVDANGVDVVRKEEPYLAGTATPETNLLGGNLRKESSKDKSYVCFTDAAGSKWKRSGTGVLKEVRDYPYDEAMPDAGLN